MDPFSIVLLSAMAIVGGWMGFDAWKSTKRSKERRDKELIKAAEKYEKWQKAHGNKKPADRPAKPQQTTAEMMRELTASRKTDPAADKHPPIPPAVGERAPTTRLEGQRSCPRCNATKDANDFAPNYRHVQDAHGKALERWNPTAEGRSAALREHEKYTTHHERYYSSSNYNPPNLSQIKNALYALRPKPVFEPNELAMICADCRHIAAEDLRQRVGLLKAGLLAISGGSSPTKGTRSNFEFAHTDSGSPIEIDRKTRNRHTFLIGKTGSGKSSLIRNHVLQDMDAGDGVCVIDPHGDLIDDLLGYVPEERIGDVVYFNPADERCPSFNLFATPYPPDKLAADITSALKLFFGDSWGPRLEYILMNSLLILLADRPNGAKSFADLRKLLVNAEYRETLVGRCANDTLRSWWEDEFPNFPKDAAMPILNKLGGFLRPMSAAERIFTSAENGLNMDEAMNQRKIVLCSLSKGELGDEPSRLVGGLIVTAVCQAALARTRIPESKRADFYFYVDEFQNYAIDSFASIFSEARKYRLNLTVANQLLKQIPPSLLSNVFGNVGTVGALTISAEDAATMTREMSTKKKVYTGLGTTNERTQRIAAAIATAVDQLTEVDDDDTSPRFRSQHPYWYDTFREHRGPPKNQTCCGTVIAYQALLEVWPEISDDLLFRVFMFPQARFRKSETYEINPERADPSERTMTTFKHTIQRPGFTRHHLHAHQVLELAEAFLEDPNRAAREDEQLHYAKQHGFVLPDPKLKHADPYTIETEKDDFRHLVTEEVFPTANDFLTTPPLAGFVKILSPDNVQHFTVHHPNERPNTEKAERVRETSTRSTTSTKKPSFQSPPKSGSQPIEAAKQLPLNPPPKAEAKSPKKAPPEEPAEPATDDLDELF